MKLQRALPLLVCLCLSGSVVAAPGESGLQVHLVMHLADTGQTLVKDAGRDIHVLLRVGDTIAGHKVIYSAADKLVLVSTSRPDQHVVLLHTAVPAGGRSSNAPLAPLSTQLPTRASELLDPYAEAVAGSPADRRPRRLAPSPSALAKAPAVPLSPTPPAVAPNHSAKPKVLTPLPASRIGLASPLAIQRAAFEQALTDFHQISRQLTLRRESLGQRIVRLDKTSYFWGLGLRAGDLVLSVDGQRVTDLDQAAAIYARLFQAKAFAIRVRRGREHLTLRYQFRG